VQPNGVRVYTFDNIGDDRLIGASIFGSSQLTRKLNVNTTIGTNYHDINSTNKDGVPNAGWHFNGKIDLTYKPGSLSTILLGGGGENGSLYFQTRNRGYYWSYLSYQQDILKKKLKLEARIDSPFEKYLHNKGESFSKDFFEKFNARYPSRTLSFKVSYNFGSMKDQVKKSKKSIRNDDVKQGG